MEKINEKTAVRYLVLFSSRVRRSAHPEKQGLKEMHGKLSVRVYDNIRSAIYGYPPFVCRVPHILCEKRVLYGTIAALEEADSAARR